jgi:hypothetical protein
VVLDRGRTTIYPGGLAYFLDKSGHKLPGSDYTLRIG